MTDFDPIKPGENLQRLRSEISPNGLHIYQLLTVSGAFSKTYVAAPNVLAFVLDPRFPSLIVTEQKVTNVTIADVREARVIAAICTSAVAGSKEGALAPASVVFEGALHRISELGQLYPGQGALFRWVHEIFRRSLLADNGYGELAMHRILKCAISANPRRRDQQIKYALNHPQLSIASIKTMDGLDVADEFVRLTAQWLGMSE